MSEIDALRESAERGAEARQLLGNPLIETVFGDLAEKTTEALLQLPVEAHEQRLALCTVLRVLRGMPASLKKYADDGEFDARRLAQLVEKETHVRN